MQILKEGTGGFRGWLVTIIDGNHEIDRNKTIKDENATKDEDKYKSGNDFLEESISENLARITTEEQIMQHAQGVREGKPFDSKNWEWNIGGFLQGFVSVPYSYWCQENVWLYLFRDNPEHCNSFLGVRPAARVLKNDL